MRSMSQQKQQGFSPRFPKLMFFSVSIHVERTGFLVNSVEVAISRGLVSNSVDRNSNRNAKFLDSCGLRPKAPSTRMTFGFYMKSFRLDVLSALVSSGDFGLLYRQPSALPYLLFPCAMPSFPSQFKEITSIQTPTRSRSFFCI